MHTHAHNRDTDRANGLTDAEAAFQARVIRLTKDISFITLAALCAYLLALGAILGASLAHLL